MKVYELAKEFNLESKELLQMLSDMDISAKSHLSVLTDSQVKEIRNHLSSSTEVQPEQVQKEVVKQASVKPKKWEADLNRMICVKNIARGKLIYKSKRQFGYTIEWEESGDVNYIELSELVNLKNTDRRFITEPWIRIVEDDEIEILKYLNIFKYYEELLGINDIRQILNLDFESFKKKFDTLPNGYRNTVAEYAAQMIKDGTLDSIRIKEYIEKELGIDLDILIRPSKQERDAKKRSGIINIG